MNRFDAIGTAFAATSALDAESNGLISFFGRSGRTYSTASRRRDRNRRR